MTAVATGAFSLNLKRVFVFRALLLLAQLGTVMVAAFVLGLALPLPTLLTVIGLYAVFNVWTAMRLWRGTASSTEAQIFGQQAIDVFALTVLLYFTGGATNPFISFYILPLIVTASMLSARYTWAMAALTVGAYSFLMYVYVPLPHVHDFRLHLYGMWAGFSMAAALIAYVVIQIRAALAQREAALAQGREAALRNERIVALATLAAGAAHELGTPLSTMAIVVNELRAEIGVGDVRERLTLLREQIARCKQTLATLAAAAGETKAQGGRSIPLDAYLKQLVAQWRRIRLNLGVVTNWRGPRPGPTIVADETLSQAITIVLNNAADVSPADIEIDGGWDDAHLEFEVRDRGPGIAPDIAAILGRTPYTSKGDSRGLGLGLILAHTAIQRLGGEVRLRNRDGGGTCTDIRLPLALLRA